MGSGQTLRAPRGSSSGMTRARRAPRSCLRSRPASPDLRHPGTASERSEGRRIRDPCLVGDASLRCRTAPLLLHRSVDRLPTTHGPPGLRDGLRPAPPRMTMPRDAPRERSALASAAIVLPEPDASAVFDTSVRYDAHRPVPTLIIFGCIPTDCLLPYRVSRGRRGGGDVTTRNAAGTPGRCGSARRPSRSGAGRNRAWRLVKSGPSLWIPGRNVRRSARREPIQPPRCHRQAEAGERRRRPRRANASFTRTA